MLSPGACGRELGVTVAGSFLLELCCRKLVSKLGQNGSREILNDLSTIFLSFYMYVYIYIYICVYLRVRARVGDRAPYPHYY